MTNNFSQEHCLMVEKSIEDIFYKTDQLKKIENVDIFLDMVRSIDLSAEAYEEDLKEKNKILFPNIISTLNRFLYILEPKKFLLCQEMILDIEKKKETNDVLDLLLTKIIAEKKKHLGNNSSIDEYISSMMRAIVGIMDCYTNINALILLESNIEQDKQLDLLRNKLCLLRENNGYVCEIPHRVFYYQNRYKKSEDELVKNNGREIFKNELYKLLSEDIFFIKPLVNEIKFENDIDIVIEFKCELNEKNKEYLIFFKNIIDDNMNLLHNDYLNNDDINRIVDSVRGKFRELKLKYLLEVKEEDVRVKKKV